MSGGSRAHRARRDGPVWFLMLALFGCDGPARSTSALLAQEALPIVEFAALVDRISEPGGYFDTDNLISNEAGYLNVIDALARRGTSGGALVGVGPDQSFSYAAELRPEIVFVIDIRRDNLLHHLLLKALIERAPTRIELLSALHGVEPPESPSAWRDADVERIVAWVDSAWSDPTPAASQQMERDRLEDAERVAALQADVAQTIGGYGIDLSSEDFATIRRFHDAFVRAGLGLRFTSFGRPPRSYYPTYRQLLLETDVDGDRASWLSSAERYETVRALQLANRIVPVVGDLAGDHALRELGDVLREMGVDVTAFYTSNVEYYLWQDRTFDRWLANLRGLPAADDAVLVRSYFSNVGRQHPSAVPGYYATQLLQPIATLRAGGFESYWDLVTRDVVPLR